MRIHRYIFLQLPLENGFLPGTGLYPAQHLYEDFGFLTLGLDFFRPHLFTLGIYVQIIIVYTLKILVVNFIARPFSVHSLFFFL